MTNNTARCLITGGNGFQGYHLTKSLLTLGYSVRCLDRYKPGWKLQEKVEFIEGDFSATHLIADAIKGCDLIFHLACTTLPQTSNEDPDFDVSSNVLGTIRMLNEAVKANVKRFIFISSGGTVYGIPSVIPIPENHPTNPTCSYGITKLTIEKYLRLYFQMHGLNTCSIRLSNPYGEYQRVDSIQGVIAAFCHKAITGQQINIWGDGRVKRDFIYISDVMDAFIKLIDAPVSGCEINIGSGSALSLNEIVGYIEQVTGKNVDRNYSKARAFDVPISELDISFAREKLQWEPKISVYDGIDRTIKWMKSLE
ncbi:MAG: NAD-dependent epimerase/dehydratase family protein [Bacteroidetes bacterium]|nr:NAD-dependent epimerase/dehydratase family protein [Bacteroidota bacterium]